MFLFCVVFVYVYVYVYVYVLCWCVLVFCIGVLYWCFVLVFCIGVLYWCFLLVFGVLYWFVFGAGVFLGMFCIGMLCCRCLLFAIVCLMNSSIRYIF